MRTRFVSIMSLSSKGIGSTKHTINQSEFNDFFTLTKPVIFNFHGYPQTLKQILFDYIDDDRATINGYIESGSTTTPFDMQVRNNTDRYNLVIQALKYAYKNKVITEDQKDKLVRKYRDKLTDHFVYIQNHCVDPKEIEDWTWKKK